jgi:hypothetical protein
MCGIGKRRCAQGSTSFLATLRRPLVGGVLATVLLLGLLSGCGFVRRVQAPRGAGLSAAAANRLVSVWDVKCYPVGYPPGGFAPIEGVIRFDANGCYDYEQWSIVPGSEPLHLSERGTYQYDAARGQLTLRSTAGVVTGPIPYHGEDQIQGPGPFNSVIVCTRIGP